MKSHSERSFALLMSKDIRSIFNQLSIDSDIFTILCHFKPEKICVPTLIFRK